VQVVVPLASAKWSSTQGQKKKPIPSGATSHGQQFDYLTGFLEWECKLEALTTSRVHVNSKDGVIID
jgi:hypothetical protein